MTYKNFYFLKDHFAYEVIDLNSNHRFSQILFNKNKESYPEFTDLPYAIAFYDKSSDYILSWSLSSSKDVNYESFEFYLQQLPGLKLSDVAYLLALVDSDAQLLNDMFRFKENYASEFCRDFLKDTYGYVVYTYQLMQLISFCMPPGKANHHHLNEYRRGYNARLRKTFDELETMRLPDGYNLGEFLRQYTPVRFNADSSAYGFVRTPVHDIAHEFIVCAENYISWK